MKIVCLIDSLNTGGAERQLVELATGLKRRGHEVVFCIYHQLYYFANAIEQEGIELVEFKYKNKLDLILKIRSRCKSLNPDIIISYLLGPNAIAILSSIGKRNWKVVVTELSLLNHNSRGNIRLKMIRQLYRLADWIISNSYTNMNYIQENVNYTKAISSVVWNGVDLEEFNNSYPKKRVDTFRFLCVASMLQLKNAPRVVEALNILRKRIKRKFHFRWVGSYRSSVSDSFIAMRETMQRVKKFGLENEFTFVGNVDDVSVEMKNADSFVLCSLTEGLPNAICEGMASGLPIVASAVSDVPRMVEDGVNGFLCDPISANSIADALEKIISLDEKKLNLFGFESRQKAELMFSKERFIDTHENIFRKLRANSRL